MTDGKKVEETETSDHRLQMNILRNFEKAVLSDVTIFVQGREIPAHKFILAAQSGYFAREFSKASATTDIQFDGKYKVVKALIRFMYFGGVLFDDLTPEDGLDLLVISEELAVTAMRQEDILPLILPRLTKQNCIDALCHHALPRYDHLLAGVVEFVGDNFLSILKGIDGYTTMSTEYKGGQLMGIPKDFLSSVLKVACKHIATDLDAGLCVNFVKAHAGCETVCDLLRESKTWRWADPGEANFLRSPDGRYQSVEWRIENIQQAMAQEHAPGRIVVGEFFDWQIRLDYGDRNKLRIVYESATPKPDDGELLRNRCINRFPAAMFGWRVFFRNKDVYDEKAVFICFPENVSLHWSTTLPRPEVTELTPNDDLVIQVHMAENPVLSLVLYYFSSDLKSTVYNEDILNRLPHIEYRCLSSYSLVKTHIHEA